jgi:hypothetical protein
VCWFLLVARLLGIRFASHARGTGCAAAVAAETASDGFPPHRSVPQAIASGHVHEIVVLALDGVVAFDLSTPVEVFGRARENGFRIFDCVHDPLPSNQHYGG